MATKNNNARGILTRDLRLNLRKCGYSVIGWSRANGYSKATVHRALSGMTNGKRAREIRAKVENLKG